MKTVLISTLSVAALDVVGVTGLSVDFSTESGRIRPALHSSGWSPRSYPRYIQNDDETIKSMNLTYARTHDWALVNSGQRVVDYQYLFPLINKDPKDPSNYVFEPTDHLLSLARNVGLKLFYRLGTSIEHTAGVHFNARVPSDYDKVAEVFAATVRHYNRGWANGFDWNIDYWEIWNEPDGIRNMWCLPDEEGGQDWNGMRDRFIPFFVTCLKRLKGEFPDIKVGGPALCLMNADYFRRLLMACRVAGVAPDFISWHYYGSDPDALLKTTFDARKLCDEMGFSKMELIVNEYHYILTWDGIHGRNSTPTMVQRAQEGPTGHNGIDAACFYLTMLSLFQRSPLDQAYWYGCFAEGNWGYMDYWKRFNKPYYAARLFGKVVHDYSGICDLQHKGTLTALALRSRDGRKNALLVTDYRGSEQVLEFDIVGLPEACRSVSATVLDHTRDALPCAVDWKAGRLTIVKADKNSAAFLIAFER